MNLSLTEIDASRLSAIAKILKDTSHYHISTFSDVDIALLVKLIKSWPVSMLFPGDHSQFLNSVVVRLFYLYFTALVYDSLCLAGGKLMAAICSVHLKHDTCLSCLVD